MKFKLQSLLLATILLLTLTVRGAGGTKDPTETAPLTDTLPANRQQVDKNKSTAPGAAAKGIPQQPSKIKKVPKAKRQSPPQVVKPRIKVKPVKVIKPKITGKGIGR